MSTIGEDSAAAPRPFLLHAMGVLLVVAAVAAAFLLSTNRKQAEAKEAGARAEELRAGPVVQAVAVVEAPQGRTLTLTGEVRAYRQSTLFAKVSGYLKMIKVDKGERVRSGEVLGVIEAPEVEQEAQSKEADLAIKKLTDARYKVLAQSGLVTQQEREKAEADVHIATADLSRLNTLRGYEVIRAPFDGVITARYADPGALLQSATSSQSALALVDVADIDRLRVFVYVAQAEAFFVREGDPVTIWTDEQPDRKVAAKITRYTKQLDTRTRTMLTEIEVDNKDQVLYPGTFVRVAMKLSTPAALSIPAEAVSLRGGKSVVARVVGSKVTFVPVEIGDSDGQVVRVRSGLSKGDLVIVHPGDDVVEGGAVQILK